MNWFIYTILGLIFLGISSVFTKISWKYLNAKSILIHQTLGILIMSLFILIFLKEKLIFNNGSLFGFLIGITGSIGIYFFIQALKTGKTSIVVSIVALNPIIPILFSAIFLKESLSLKQIIGIISAFIGIILLSI